MKSANVKGLVAKTMIIALAAGTLMFAGAAKADAQQLAVGVQFGHPVYGYDRDDYARRQAYIEHERWEAEQREAYTRQQAYVQHERQEQWERAHRYDHDGDRYDRR